MENTTTQEDFYEDDTPQSLLIRNREGGWNRKEMLYLIGAGILILIILAIALWPEGETELPPIGSASSSGISATAGVRLDALDQRLTEIENRLNQAPGISGQNEGAGADIAGRARENSERIEQVLARLETIDRRLSEMQKTVENRPAARAAQTEAKTPSQPAGQQYYEVKKGDTPYSIARQQKMALKALLDLNGMNSRSVIHPGDRIRVK